MVTPNYDAFLQDPQKFAIDYSTQVKHVATLWIKVADELKKNAPIIESGKYRGKIIGQHPKYVKYKSLLSQIYSSIEKKVGKAEAVLGMTVRNWRPPSKGEPDRDFSDQVLQFFGIIEQLNVLIDSAKLPTKLASQLHCHLFAATFELAGKRLVQAANLLKRRSDINDIGVALTELDNLGYKNLHDDFDNKLRNAINHENYLIDDGPKPKIEYANISSSKGSPPKVQYLGKIDLDAIQDKTVGITMFLMAALYVNAISYADLINDCLTKINLT